MGLLTSKKAEAEGTGAPGLSVVEAQRALDAKIMEVGRLRAVLAGEVSETRVQAVARTVFGRTGVAEQVTIDEPVVSSRVVSAAERVQARRLLPGAEEAVYLAQEGLEEAKAMHETATRARQQAALETGMQTVRRELPALIKDLRAVQARAMEFARTVDQLDQALGRDYFQGAVWAYLRSGEALDFWVASVTATYLDR